MDTPNPDTTKPAPSAAAVPKAPADEPLVPLQESKRFVRTFASDMAALKSGKAASLALVTPQPEAVPAPAVPSAAEAPAVVLPAAHILPAMPAAPLSQGIPVQEPLIVPKLERRPEPPPPPPPKPEPPVHQMPGPSPIETYAGDFARRMKESHASKATVLAAEQDAGGAPTRVTPEQARSSILYISAGALLLIMSAGGGYLAYTRYMTQNAPVILAPAAATPIFVDDRQVIAGRGSELMKAIEQSATRALAPNSVRLLTIESATGDSVFSALELPAPGILLRNTRAEGSMAGIVNSGSRQSPFFIVAVTSYGSTLSGMLAWETRMTGDLKPLFPPLAAPAPVATSTATSTAPRAATPAITTTAGTFKDTVIANHDARVYTDAAGQSLVYGYWDQNTLVIVRDEDAFTTIMQRLATSRKQ